MSKIVVNVVQKFQTYVIDGISLEVYKDGRVFRDGRDLSQNKPDKQGYIRIKIRQKGYLLHRIIASAHGPDIIHDPRIKIDHEETKSNVLSNLRMSTQTENTRNRVAHTGSLTGRKNITVKYRPYGNYWDWIIQIRAKDMEFYKSFRGGDGTIPDVIPTVPQFIIDIRNAKLIEYHGKFARLD